MRQCQIEIGRIGHSRSFPIVMEAKMVLNTSDSSSNSKGEVVVGGWFSKYPNWNLNKVVVILLAFVFLGLFFDLRYEHVDKLRHHTLAWIPIVYSGAMVIACLLGLSSWERQGRQALFYAFAVGIAVGLLGFLLHNGKHIISDLAEVLLAWVKPEHLSDHPPTLAPLTFAGLGVVGMLVCTFKPLTGITK